MSVHNTKNIIYKKELCRFNWKLQPNRGKQKKNNCSVFERRYKYHGIHKRGARMNKIEVRLRRMALVVSETLLP